MLKNYVKTARQLARQWHKGQLDKAGKPYIQHIDRVVSMMNSDEEKATAYLHDILEDTTITTEYLEKKGIPKGIISAVLILTKNKKENYFEYLERIKNNPIAKKVKLADLKHNSDLVRLKNITKIDIEREKKYKKAIEYLNSEITQITLI